jgi:hypothetical protein
MKRILVVAMFALTAFAAIALAQGEAAKKEPVPAAAPAAKPATAPAAAAAKPVSMTGEVIDLSCYMDHGATGMDHAKCAAGCIKKGMPVGFLTSDGVMYVLLGENHEPANAQVADFAGKKSTVTGTVKENKGFKAIMLTSIAEAK